MANKLDNVLEALRDLHHATLIHRDSVEATYEGSAATYQYQMYDQMLNSINSIITQVEGLIGQADHPPYPTPDQREILTSQWGPVRVYETHHDGISIQPTTVSDGSTTFLTWEELLGIPFRGNQDDTPPTPVGSDDRPYPKTVCITMYLRDDENCPLGNSWSMRMHVDGLPYVKGDGYYYAQGAIDSAARQLENYFDVTSYDEQEDE